MPTKQQQTEIVTALQIDEQPGSRSYQRRSIYVGLHTVDTFSSVGHTEINNKSHPVKLHTTTHHGCRLGLARLKNTLGCVVAFKNTAQNLGLVSYVGFSAVVMLNMIVKRALFFSV